MRRYGWVLWLTAASIAWSADAKYKALIIDGQNNHNWRATTPVLQRLLEETGLFAVDVATSPPKGGDMSVFQPRFEGHRLVVMNYNDFGGGDRWPAPVEAAFEKYVRGGGGLVIYHAANNAFPYWKEFNQIIVLGGWNRTEQHGPYMRYRDGKMVREASPGKSGSHGKRHPYLITVRDANHPVTAGLPAKWMHATDELYDRMRGPAEATATVLAIAYSDPATGGSGEEEPLILTRTYGKGRVFHTMLGHDLEAMNCVGFITTYQRGAEWAASGKVTVKIPPDFPTADQVKVRK
jgi:type 1 glutamine amidotransferase